MNEKEKNGEEAYEAAAAAAKEIHESDEDIPKEDLEIRRLIEERRTTPKEEKQRLKAVSKQLKNASGTENNEKTGSDSTNTRTLQRE